MKLDIIPVTSMQENVYFYYDENSLEAVVIDPGGEEEKLCRHIEENGLKVKAILLTHGHGDHIGAVEAIKELTGAPLMAHKDEAELLGNSGLNMSRYFKKELELTADKLLSEGDIIEIGAGTLKVIHTPGHTPGGVSFYDEKEGILFSGDTLFRGSIGRTDFETGDSKALLSALREKLMALPDEVKVYPGHGAATTIKYERSHNPFVKGAR